MRVFRIVSLYEHILLNKKNLIFIILGYLSIIVAAYFNLNLGFNKGVFPLIRDDYLRNYTEATIFYQLLINLLLISFIALTEQKDYSIILNQMLSSRNGRIRVYLGKTLCYLKLLVFLSLLNFIILEIEPIFFYPKYEISFKVYLILIYILMLNLIFFFFTFILVSLVKSFLVCVIPVIIFLLLELSKENFDYVLIPKFENIYLTNQENMILLIPVVVILLMISYTIAVVKEIN